MSEAPGGPPKLEDFLGEPTRDLAAWRWLWQEDVAFPVRSHRGFLGRLLVACKRALRPLVKTPQNDLWERQRVFNLLLLERLQGQEQRRHEARLGQLESQLPIHLKELLAHNDALFALLDQKVDRYRREARDLLEGLSAALAATGPPAQTPAVGASAEAPAATALARVLDEQAYLELEKRYRGTEGEIAERLAAYLPFLRGKGEVLDLGCGRGEALAVLTAAGIAARGIDTSARMVATCRQRGLEAEEGDLFAGLAAVPLATLGGVVSFHVIEHLEATALDRLVRLAFRALQPGGVLVLETPNPLSLVVAARNFWLDPTHRRPVHPESLALSCRLAGFEPVRRLELRPFAAEERLPELDPGELAGADPRLLQRLNELRDRLDDLLFGAQDYALVAEKPAAG